MCVPYDKVDSASYKKNLQQADKFHILAQKDHRAVLSPCRKLHSCFTSFLGYAWENLKLF